MAPSGRIQWRIPTGGLACPGPGSTTCPLEPPPLGSFGNTRKNTVLGPNARLWELSLLKNFTLPKETKLQFRAEFFNLLNHTNFVLNQTGTDLQSPTFGFPDQARNPREVQFALKFYY